MGQRQDDDEEDTKPHYRDTNRIIGFKHGKLATLLEPRRPPSFLPERACHVAKALVQILRFSGRRKTGGCSTHSGIQHVEWWRTDIRLHLTLKTFS
jgi:hypothetical protein